MTAGPDPDLRPRFGARFVFRRRASVPSPTYDLEIWLPEGEPHRATLCWGADDRAVLEPTCPDAWAQDEALKLARVLHREPSDRLVRWRG